MNKTLAALRKYIREYNQTRDEDILFLITDLRETLSEIVGKWIWTVWDEQDERIISIACIDHEWEIA